RPEARAGPTRGGDPGGRARAAPRPHLVGARCARRRAGRGSPGRLMLRRLILAAADSPRVQRFVAKYGMRLGAARFVAGETLDEAVATLRGLNEQGLRTNTTLLGEYVKDAAESEGVVATYEGVLRRIQVEKLQTNVALKLTHLGVTLDEELGYSNVER